jgi:hypothetical protein
LQLAARGAAAITTDETAKAWLTSLHAIPPLLNMVKHHLATVAAVWRAEAAARTAERAARGPEGALPALLSRYSLLSSERFAYPFSAALALPSRCRCGW